MIRICLNMSQYVQIELYNKWLRLKQNHSKVISQQTKQLKNPTAIRGGNPKFLVGLVQLVLQPPLTSSLYLLIPQLFKLCSPTQLRNWSTRNYNTQPQHGYIKLYLKLQSRKKNIAIAILLDTVNLRCLLKKTKKLCQLSGQYIYFTVHYLQQINNQ